MFRPRPLLLLPTVMRMVALMFVRAIALPVLLSLFIKGTAFSISLAPLGNGFLRLFEV